MSNQGRINCGENLSRAAKETDSRPKCSVTECLAQFGVIFGLLTGIFCDNKASFGKL